MAFEKIFTVGTGGDYTTFAAFQTAQEGVAWSANNWTPVCELISTVGSAEVTNTWTGLDLTHRLKIRPGEGYDHNMDFDFSSIVGFVGGNPTLVLSQQFVDVEGVYVEKTDGTVNYNLAIDISSTDVTLNRILIYDSSTVPAIAIYRRAAGTDIVTNCHARRFHVFNHNGNARHGDCYNCIIEDTDDYDFGNDAKIDDFYNCLYINITNATVLPLRYHSCASTTATQLSSTEDYYTSDVVDADFEDKTNGDYRLSSSSGLIAQGISYFSIFQKDADNNYWPSITDGESGWDIGWNYQAGVTPATAVLVTNPSKHDEFQFNADGSFEYIYDSVTYTKPDTDSFTYKVNDSRGDSNTATVNLTINDDGVQQANQNLTHVVGLDTFVWTINGWDAIVTTGTFNDGSYYAVPASGSVVTLSAVTPATYNPVAAEYTNPQNHGLVINPDASSGDTMRYNQGLLPTATQPYLALLDQRAGLPLALAPDLSIIAPNFIYDTGRTSQLNGQCISTYSVLTVLDAVPAANSFRPSYFGTDKHVFTASDFDFTALPQLTSVDSSTNTWTYTEIIDYFESTWCGYQINQGEYGRGFVPDDTNIPNYSADIASDINDMIFSVMTTDPFTGDKQSAVYALLQSGIDLYYGLKAGFKWGPGGAGQNVGKYPLVLFFGALVKDTAIKTYLASLKDNYPNEEGLPFQELGQVRRFTQGSNVPIWGDELGRTGPSYEDTYWNGLMAGNAHDSVLNGLPHDTGSNARNIGDPYGYIDGPIIEPGTQYMTCCSSSIYVGLISICEIWAEFKAVMEHTDLYDYVNRISQYGTLANNDDVAPPDPRDCVDTDTLTPDNTTYLGTRTYYGVTWGPDPSNPGQAITNTQATAAGHPNSPTTGRFYKINGVSIIYELLRFSLLSREMWSIYNPNTLPSAPTVSGFNPPDGNTTTNYIYEFFNLFSGAVRPRDFTLAAGTLPPGLSIDRGFLVGLPTTTGTYSGISITGTTEGGSVTTATTSITIT